MIVKGFEDSEMIDIVSTQFFHVSSRFSLLNPFCLREIEGILFYSSFSFPTNSLYSLTNSVGTDQLRYRSGK